MSLFEAAGIVAAVNTGVGRRAARQRMAWMDELRGLAVLSVIFFHATTILRRFAPEVPDVLQTVAASLAPFRMPLLMFLSGMLLSRSLAKNDRVFFAGKLSGIAWPYLLWSTVFLAVSAQLSQANLVGVLVLPPTYLWYLWFLLAYYVIAWAMTRLRIPAWFAMLVAFVGAFGPEIFRFSRFCFLFLFFLAGHLYATRGDSAERLKAWRVPLIAGSAAVTLAGALYSGLISQLRYDPVTIAVPAAAILLALLVAPQEDPVSRPRRALGYVGRNSIVFYVTHFSAIWLALWWLRHAGVDEPWLMFPAGLGVGLGVGLAFTAARARLRAVAALFDWPRKAEPFQPPAGVPSGLTVRTTPVAVG